MLGGLRKWVLGLLVMCAGVAAMSSENAPAAAQAPVDSGQETQATLVVLNISGPTLFASNQDITDNGVDLVSLPRNTFRRVSISPGPHEFRFKPFPSGKRVAQLNAQAGNTYYLVVGYSPGKSWAFPLGGDPMTIQTVGEEDAKRLMQQMEEVKAP